METLKPPFLSPFLPPSKPRPSNQSKPFRRISCSSSDRWSLSDGNISRKPYVRNPHHTKKPLSDDDARRIIHAKAQYLTRLRRNQGPQAQTPRWIQRTPEQMVRMIEDDRDGHLYGKHVLAAIRVVRGLSGRPEGSYDMREVMGGFVAKLTFREMCVVLKEQKGWRQARDFFAWMKLQLCYKPSVIVYTVILRIYGQVGKIKLAEQTFLEMLEAGCEPDEVACGTLLCAYAKWGRYKAMLTFHNAVRRREILPSVTVYNFMISSLQKQKLHAQAIQLWRQMLAAGAEPNHFTYTIVIASYIKDDYLDDALEIYRKMRKLKLVPEEASYGLLISLSIKHKKWDEAMKLYEDMKSEDLVPSNYTCASLLTLYYKTGDYSKALALFSDMVRNNIDPDEVIYGIIIRIYGKLGLYEDAVKTFEEADRSALLKNEKTYVAMAHVHLKSGNTVKALEVLDLLKSRKIELSTFSHSLLLHCFVVQEDVDSAEQVFQVLSNCGISDVVCYNELLGLYNKLNILEKAKTLIAQMRNEKVYFDEDLYRTVLQVYSKAGMLVDAEMLLEEMDTNGVSLDKYTKTSLMAMYGHCSGIQKAESLFRTLEIPDATSLSVMLCLYTEAGDINQSERVLTALLQASGGLSLASQLINKFLKQGDMTKAHVLYNQVIGLGSVPHDGTIASMISLYSRQQQLQHAESVFLEVSNPPRVGSLVYSSMVDAYAKCGKTDEAYLLYKHMSQHNLSLDVVTLSMVVHALAKHGKYEDAESIILDTFQGEMELDTVAYNTYIKAMLDAGKLHLAVGIYERMISSGVSPSIRTYNTMISVYGRGGKLDKAIDVFNTAERLCVSIDEKTYTNMVCCYGKAGRSSEASLLFTKMQQHGIKPGKISYNVMLDAYASAGLHDEAYNLLNFMEKDGHSPDLVSYLSLIRAYIKNQHYVQAEEIICNMQKEGLSPSCTHFKHLILAYVNNGSIDDAERIFHQMKQLGLSPDLACCRAMLRAYLDYGHVQKGISFFQQIDGSVKPDGFILSAAVHLYDFVGKVAEARDVLNFMNSKDIIFLRSLRVGWKAEAAGDLSNV